jgi:hypothetical protein
MVPISPALDLTFPNPSFNLSTTPCFRDEITAHITLRFGGTVVESTGDGHEPLQHRTPPLVARRRGVLCRRDHVGEQHIGAVPSWRRSKCDSARMAPGVERIDDAGPHSALPVSGKNGLPVTVSVHAMRGKAWPGTAIAAGR